MNLKIISACLVSGQHLADGEIIRDAPPALASDLISAGRAVVTTETSRHVTARDPQVETRDPQVEPTSKRKK
jgi:hypothetical protein